MVNRFSLAFGVLLLVGCATIPGKTRDEQVITIDNLVERTLFDLESKQPAAKQELKDSVGYVIMSNKITKIPAFGAGGGYGVAIDNKTQQRTYLRMSRFDIGAGWGARSVRPVAIFQDKKKFEEFIDGAFEVKMGAEASAKVGDAGAAGGAGGRDIDAKAKGYTSYLLTDAGVSATASLAIIRVKPVKLKHEKR